MRKRLLWFSGVLFGVMFVAMPLVSLLNGPPAPGVTPENFKRLYAGMSEDEAKAILGCEPDFQRLMLGGHINVWHRGDRHVQLYISDPLDAGIGPRGPSLGDGFIRVSHGSTQKLRRESAFNPIDQLRLWLG
jgi:hypothetical protein